MLLLGHNRIGNAGAMAIAEMLEVGSRPKVTPKQLIFSCLDLDKNFSCGLSRISPR